MRKQLGFWVRQPDVVAHGILIALVLLFFWRVLFTGHWLLPADALYSTPPWSAFAAQFGVTHSHNELIADMILQNYSWKSFARESILHGQVPLWNPNVLSGVPFLAAGQYAVLYPLGIVFWLLPVGAAYGYFTALHILLAGVFTYWLVRLLGGRPAGSLLAGIAFMFCAFLIVSFVWPMILSTAVYMPLLVLLVELVIRRALRGPRWSPTLFASVPLLGLAVGLQFLAGHLEISFYNLFTIAFYAAARLLWAVAGSLHRPHLPRGEGWGEELSDWPAAANTHPPRSKAAVLRVRKGGELPAAELTSVEAGGAQPLAPRPLSQARGPLAASAAGTVPIDSTPSPALPPRGGGRPLGRLLPVVLAGVLLAVGVGIGFLVAAAQLIPFYEVIRENFRAGSVTLDQVLGWALPKVRLLAYLVPDLFGNPSRHAVLDPLAFRVLPIEVQHGDRLLSFVEVNPALYKNYVEGGGYVGLLPLLLAPFGWALTRNRYAGIFGTYGVVCLLLAFGTPLYAVLWHVPGFDQLRTAFRWMLPLSLCLAVLAGFGVDRLAGELAPRTRRIATRAFGLLAGAGALVLVGLAGSIVLRGVTLRLAEAAINRFDALRTGFGSAQLLYAYQFQNFFVFGLMLLTSALAVLWLLRSRPGTWAGYAVALVLAADLFVFGYNFNTVSRPELARFVPPSLELVRAQPGQFRTVSFNYDDTLRPISNMLAGLQDIRGYDTIILKRYVNYWSLMEEPQGLLYSMINKLVDARSLSSPLLDLMNVRYVLTTQNIGEPGYQEVYRGEINVYENEDALPRAFVVGRAQSVGNEAEALAALKAPGFDPRRVAIVEGPAPSGGDDGFYPAAIARYEPNVVSLHESSPEGGYLILTDTYFQGWEVKVDGEPAEIVRAYSIYRGVLVPAGDHTVTFRYTPLTFRLGAYLSFLGVVVAGLGLGFAGWRFAQSRGRSATTGQRLLKNIFGPMAAQLINRLMDFGFAIFMLRLLGPEAAGKYAFGVVVFGYFDIFSSFGLNTLLTREVAGDRKLAGRFFGETIVLRIGLSLFSLPLLLAVVLLLDRTSELTRDTGTVILLLGLTLLPGALNGAITALLQGFELMEYPAAISLVTNVGKVFLGIIVLLAGWGIVGLAAVAVVNSTVTALVFLWLYRTVRQRFDVRIEWKAQLATLSNAFPLMINNFLSSIFFRIDVLLLRLMQPGVGDLVNGWYTTAYRFIDGLNIIPSFFTLAIFPLMARYAKSDRESLLRGYVLSLKVLLAVALPITVGTTLIADRIILLFFPPEFTPSILALQVLIWFLPFSYINSVTHYVLIALNLQRYLTVAFIIGVAANVVGNVALIPSYSFVGAGLMTVLSEVILLLPFAYLVHKHLAPVSMLSLIVRPLLAAAVMGAVTWQLHDAELWLLVPLAAVVYLTVLWALRVFDQHELAMLRQLRARA